MTGPDRLTSILNAYVETSRIDYKSRATARQLQDTVDISSEGLQKSKEFFAGLNTETSSQEDNSSRAGSSNQQADDQLEILSLSSNASTDQIHRAFISAIKQYHPDKFNASGPEFKKLAEEKSRQIIQAYEKLTKFVDKSA